MVRQEAAIEEWRELYKLATVVGEMEPWKQFWDVDLLSIRETNSEEPVYCSILGSGGNTYGIVFYEGQKGLEGFTLSLKHEEIVVPVEYAMFSQDNLTCFWGDRRELDPQQLKIVRDLGYKYRGANKWLYFLSSQGGFFPFLPDKEEVQRLTNYMRWLTAALEYKTSHRIHVDYMNGEMYEFIWDEARERGRGGAGKIPLVGIPMVEIPLTDQALIAELKAVKKTSKSLEVDLVYLIRPIADENFSRPLNPRMAIIADHEKGYVYSGNLTKPGMDAGESLVTDLTRWILEHGKPRKIMTRNRIVNTYISDLCRICGIKTELRQNLPVIEDVMEQMERSGF